MTEKLRYHREIPDEELVDFFAAALLVCGEYEFTGSITQSDESEEVMTREYVADYQKRFDEFARSNGIDPGVSVKLTDEQREARDFPYLFMRFFWYWRDHYENQESES